MTDFDIEVPIAIVGAGACGLTAALAAHDARVEALVLERDAVPQGSTALSSGMIPACNTKAQTAAGITDSVETFAGDILAKNRGQTDMDLVREICAASGPAVDWLTDRHHIPLTLVDGFLYPGHSCARMHAPVSRTGGDLIGALNQATERVGIDVLTNALVTDLIADRDRILGLRLERPDGTVSTVGCHALILACNGYGGNPALLAEHIPAMSDSLYFGHAGNQGDAIRWGAELGAAVADMGAFQGHGAVAQPHGILITWALMMEGGIQVNRRGERFSNEHDGYSEQGRRVLAQPEGLAWCLYDQRLHDLGLAFDDYRQADAAGAIRRADTIDELAASFDLPAETLNDTIAETQRLARGKGQDRFGRDFTGRPALNPPYFGVRVTGALFHTQGGLTVDKRARVLRPNGTPLPNLFAGGGAARGLSGPSDWGYLSGNGLLTAIVLGRQAGRSASALLETS